MIQFANSWGKRDRYIQDIFAIKEEILWKQLFETVENDFMIFRKATLAYYPNTIAIYMIDDLVNLVTQNRDNLMLNTIVLKEYHWNFHRISSYLMNIKHISKFDQKRYFWEGLHSILNRELDHALWFVKHDHLVSVPWDISVVMKELQRILSDDQITMKRTMIVRMMIAHPQFPITA